MIHAVMQSEMIAKLAIRRLLGLPSMIQPRHVGWAFGGSDCGLQYQMRNYIPIGFRGCQLF
jgi:hypothetical protein